MFAPVVPPVASLQSDADILHVHSRPGRHPSFAAMGGHFIHVALVTKLHLLVPTNR